MSTDDRQGTGSRRWTADWNSPSAGEIVDITDIKENEVRVFRELGGFGYAYAEPERAGGIRKTYALMLPYWFITLVFITYPAIAFMRSPYMYGKKKLCNKCGHNLHGITAPRCPKCGERI
ncbi:MAG: hypothetical protein ACYTBZ_19870 [Planctomycetota bacterium]